jgi:hypothetical protein
MSKEVEKVFCQCCESEYKVMYEPENTSGLPKFCVFCSEPLYDGEEKLYEEEEDDS